MSDEADNKQPASDFMLGQWNVHVLRGPGRVMDDVGYVSFSGDFGFRHGFGLPCEAAISGHARLERDLLSHFDFNVINFEFILPGIGGSDEVWDSQFRLFQKARAGGETEGTEAFPLKWHIYLESLMLSALGQSGFHAVSLANNHALDYGADGTAYNREKLSQAGIEAFGIKQKPHLGVGLGGSRIAVFGMTDYLDRKDSGDVIFKTADVASVKEQIKAYDLAIAFAQLISRSRYPSPYELEQVDALIEAGFGLIICTGSHWVKGFCVRRGVPVFFGLGNHLFSYTGDFTEPVGMNCVAGLRQGKIVQLFVIPFNNDLGKGLVGPLSEKDFRSFLGTFRERSEFSERKFFQDGISLYELKRSLRGYGFLPTEATLTDIGKMDAKSRTYLAYAFRTLVNHYPGLLKNFLRKCSALPRTLLSLPFFGAGLIAYALFRALPFLRRRSL